MSIDESTIDKVSRVDVLESIYNRLKFVKEIFTKILIDPCTIFIQVGFD